MVTNMKTTIFRKILNEELIEVNKSVAETIQFLCKLSTPSKQALPNDTGIYFDCSKKGKITVNYSVNTSSFRNPENMYPLYEVHGRVLSKDNKTYIKISTVYNKYNLFLQCFFKILGVLMLPLYILSRIPLEKFNLPFFIILTIITICIFLTFYTPISQQRSRGLTLLPLMEKEIKKRVETIEQWEK